MWRTCKVCGKATTKGYCIEGGLEYYCSDECLHKVYTPEEWDEMYTDGGDSYWTEWYSLDVWERDDPYWKAVIVTETEYFHIECFDTEEAATQFCEERDWKYTRDDGVVYPLEVHVPIED